MESTLSKAVAQFSDVYDRQARLYPALLAFMPIIVLTIALYRDKLSLVSAVVSGLVGCGALYLLAELARRQGKRRERFLWANWGGVPSTQVLRHIDGTFDPVSKQRYHSILGRMMGVRFPTPEQEASDTLASDAIYTSACNMLRDATRDTKKYGLLFRDNISYGFRRNAYGLRAVAIGLAIGCLAWIPLRHGMAAWEMRMLAAPNAEALFDAGEWISIAASSASLCLWVCFFTKDAVKEAAFTYARTLILACEVLPSKTTPASRKSEVAAV